MAWKFLNIGKANTRIDELEAQLATVSKERDEAKAALESNASDVTTQAEEIAKQLNDEKATSAALAAELNKHKDDILERDKIIATLKEQLAAKDQEVAQKVATKLVETQAALGVPPLPSIPTGGPDISQLHGLEKVIAIERADSLRKSNKN